MFDNLPPRGAEREQAIIEYLKTTDYGRCVFDMDNDQCDHYVMSMEFANGVTASFAMEAFFAKGGRRTRLMGTHGSVEGDMKTFTITDFRTGEKTNWDSRHVKEVAKYAAHGHGGGDLSLARRLCERRRQQRHFISHLVDRRVYRKSPYGLQGRGKPPQR